MTGNPFSIAEVGVQLAWFETALSSSPDRELAYSRPFISEFSSDICRLGSQIEVMDAATTLRTGNCWKNLFKNPVVVTGYPILKRTVPDSGLDISLGLMARLSNTRRLVDFCGRTFVKGFSTMLAAMTIVEDTVFWHLFYNEIGCHISYSDPRVPRHCNVPALAVKNPEAKRHILGWCDSINNYAGQYSCVQRFQM